MTAVMRCAVVLGLAATAVAPPASTDPPTLTPRTVVAVAPTAPPQERWAAQQLARHLGRWLGLAQPLAVRSPAGVGDDPAIVVGAAAAAPAAPPGTLRGLGPEGFWCRSSGSPTPTALLSSSHRSSRRPDGGVPLSTHPSLTSNDTGRPSGAPHAWLSTITSSAHASVSDCSRLRSPLCCTSALSV